MMNARFRISTSFGLVVVSLLSVGVLFVARYASPAAAASGTGTVTGQVVWCAPLPLPYGTSPEVETPGLLPGPEGAPEEMLGPGAYPPFPMPRLPRLIPAGAVVVAVQGTALNARTDEMGRFRIENVPVGQYMTIGIGPVPGIGFAFALRPNVFIEKAGQTVKLGRISLGQGCGYGPIPYMAPSEVQPDEAGM
ncbi:MAG: hypothetical protein HYU86_01195 [Chloroflexi bacterium]|nr:hypothetical protein [Chloroflexota bacterium]